MGLKRDPGCDAHNSSRAPPPLQHLSAFTLNGFIWVGFASHSLCGRGCGWFRQLQRLEQQNLAVRVGQCSRHEEPYGEGNFHLGKVGR